MKYAIISDINADQAALERVTNVAVINHEVVDEKQRQMIEAAE